MSSPDNEDGEQDTLAFLDAPAFASITPEQREFISAQFRQERREKEQEKARADQERREKEQERARADQERRDKEQERARADQERREKEQERARADQERREKEQERREKEQERARADQERREKEQERARAEQERREKEQERARADQERRDKEQERARADQERRDKEQERARADQERRDKEQERARADQERRAKEQERREKEQERREKEQASADAAAFRIALAQEQAEQKRREAGQTIDDYIARVSRLNFHLPRLLPKKTVTVATTETSSTKSKKTSKMTTGRTSINGKYYPLKLEPWDDCDAILADAFKGIRTKLVEQQVFPSQRQMDNMEEDFLQDLPQEFVNSELYLTELKTSYFLHQVLEKPTSRVLNAFSPSHKFFIDNMNAGAHIRYITKEGRQGRDQDEHSVEAQAEAQAEAPSEGQQGQGSSTEASQSLVKKPKVPVKVQADCIVLCAEVGDSSTGHTQTVTSANDDESTEEEGADFVVYRVAMGEHKPAHRLRAPMVKRVMAEGLDPEYIVKLAQRKATGRPREDAKTLLPGSAPGQVYYTYALAQTFHYMVSAGILYSYLASGDTLTFLHIPRTEPTTLRYRAVLFPDYAKGATQTGEERLAELLADTASLPVARLCGLIVKSWEEGTEGQRWRTAAFSQLATFPNLPPGLAIATAAPTPESPSSPADRGGAGKRRYTDDDDDGDRDGGRHGGRDRHRDLPSRHRTGQHTSQPAVPSPLRRHDTPPTSQRSWQGPLGPREPVFLKPSRFDPASFRPIRPYCTQACLLGLARGLPLDDACPNVFLHRRAACQAQFGAMTADDVLPARPGKEFHAIGSTEELRQLLLLQLYGNIMQDCECLLGEGLFGSIGCLFKLTLSGYGYTFVAKGVQSFDGRRLQREAVVYDRLANQQGHLVPVHLGIVKLWLPYPRDDGLLFSHMMLLSYAGPGLGSPALDFRTQPGQDLAGVDLRHEADRTWEELQALGLEDDDLENMDSNFTWCDEAARMMRIDFHCATLPVIDTNAAQQQRIYKEVVSAPLDGAAREDRAYHSNREFDEASIDTVPSTPKSLPTRGPSFRGKRSRSVSSSNGTEARPAKHILRVWESDLGGVMRNTAT